MQQSLWQWIVPEWPIIPPRLMRRLRGVPQCCWAKLSRAGVGLVLIVLITSCGTLGGPPKAIISQGIARQVEHAQQALHQQLANTTDSGSKLHIQRVKVDVARSVDIGDRSAYQVKGTYTLTGKSGNRSFRQHQSPFEVYLQRQAGEPAWLLLEPRVADDAEIYWTQEPL